MEKYLDKVSEAYFGKLGTAMAEKTRKRVHWILKKASESGDKVLDIGCSQGIISLLLGREGKNVLGIDIAEEAISYANESLAKEQKKIREQVRFLQANFLHEDFAGENFDTVVLTEVLEHFVSSNEMLKKVRNILNDDGRLVVTVPYGINDFPDHKRTLYLVEVYQEISQLFEMIDVEFLGKWIGFVAKKKVHRMNNDIPIDIIKRSEKSFYEIERELLNKIENLKNQNLKYKEDVQNLSIDYSKLQEKLNQSEKEKVKHFSEIESLKNDISNHEISQVEQVKHLRKLTEEIEEKQTIIQGLQNSNNQLQEQLSILTVKLDYEKKNLKLIKQENLESIKKLENTIELFKQKNKELLKEINIITNEKNKLKFNYEKKVMNLESNIHDLNHELKFAHNNYELKEQQLTNKLSNKNREIDNINKRVVELETLNKQMVKKEKRLSSNINILNENKIDLKKKLETLQNHNSNIEQELNALKSDSNRKNNNLKELNLILETELENILNISESLKKEVDSLKKENENLKKENQTLTYQSQETNKQFKIQLENYNQLLLDNRAVEKRTKLENIKTKEELMENITKMENLMEQLKIKHKEYKILQQRYNSLRNSKLGKLTIRYWKIKNKV